MSTATARFATLDTGHDADVYARALSARDPRFDGVFFVGITTTRVYCRPVCPARVSYPDHRRFFPSAAAAECAGYRPCLRCRPELAPGRALIDAVPRLARVAAHRIAAGALNGHSVAELAHALGVSARHLRRAMEREMGVSPVALAQTHRLLLAKQLLADTSLSVTRVAYASGFQSLRRFNAVFLEQYRMPPTAVRPATRGARARLAGRSRIAVPASAETDLLRLTLAYRPPFAWETLVAVLARDAIAGVEVVEGRRYGRTIRLDGRRGVVFVEDAMPNDARSGTSVGASHPGAPHVNVDVSPSLVPVLMPLLARLRQLLDLDVEPTVVDAHLEQGGLGSLVRQRPGLRIPGAVDAFEAALLTLLRGGERSPVSAPASGRLARRVVWALGEPIGTGFPALSRVSPTAERVADAGTARLEALGVAPRHARAIVAVARMVADGALRLEPGSGVPATHRALTEIPGIGDGLATTILRRALDWPDAFTASDRALQRAAGVASARELLVRAEAWRPWRAYAALHLRLRGERVEHGRRRGR